MRRKTPVNTLLHQVDDALSAILLAFGGVYLRWFYDGREVTEVGSLQGRFTVSPDGTFAIRQARKEDKGRVTCQPFNKVGSGGQYSAYLVVQCE